MSTPLGILEAQAYLVARGVRPAAMEALQERYVEEAHKVAERHGLLLKAQDLADGWKEVWLYRHPHVGFVIERVEEKPATGFEHWVLGKLFGYSEEAIAGYLVRIGLSTDLDEVGPVALGTRRESVGAVVKDNQLSATDAPVGTFAGLLAGGRHVAHLLSAVRRLFATGKHSRRPGQVSHAHEHLPVDVGPLRQTLGEIADLAEALPSSLSTAEIVQLLVDFFEGRGTTGYLVWARVEPAVGTGEDRVVAYPGRALVDLLAALRAGEFDPDVLREILHGASCE